MLTSGPPPKYAMHAPDENQMPAGMKSALIGSLVVHLVVVVIGTMGLPVPVIEFTLDDIVRSGMCEMWVRAFEQAQI